MPDDDLEVIVATLSLEIHLGWNEEGFWFSETVSFHRNDPVTHWQPLPKAPTPNT